MKQLVGDKFGAQFLSKEFPWVNHWGIHLKTLSRMIEPKDAWVLLYY